MDAVMESRRNSVRVRARFSLRSMENEQAGGRDGHTYLSREIKFSSSQARSGRGITYVSCSAGHEKEWRSYPVDRVKG